MTSTSKIWKELTSILSNLNNFHSLEVVDRVSETQLQVGSNSKLNNLAVKGLNSVKSPAQWCPMLSRPLFYLPLVLVICLVNIACPQWYVCRSIMSSLTVKNCSKIISRVTHSREPLQSRGGVLSFRTPGHDFQILSLESSVIKSNTVPFSEYVEIWTLWQWQKHG